VATLFLALRRLIACVLPFVGLLLTLADVTPPGLHETLPAFWAALSIYLFPALWERDPDPFSPTSFLAIASLQLWSIILAQWGDGRVDLSGLPSMSHSARVDTMNRVSYALGFSAIAYFAAYSFLGARLKGSVFGTFPSRWDAPRFGLVVGVLAVVFAISYGYFQSRVGVGLGTLSLNEGRELLRSDPTLSWVQRGVYLGILPLALLADRVLQKPVRWDFAALVFIGSVIYAYLILRLGPRAPAVVVLGILVVCFHYKVRRVPVPALVGALFMAIVFLNFLSDLRGVREGDQIELIDSDRLEARSVAAKHEKDRTRLPAMATVMYFFPEKNDYLLGESFLAIAIAPIPRWVLPEKKSLVAADTGIVYNLIGIPAPSAFPFVAYANFGWIGLVIGQALLGLFHRSLYNWFSSDRMKPGAVSFYVLLLVQFSPTSLGVAAALGSVLPLWLILRFIGERRTTRKQTSLRANLLSPVTRG
jgi:xanthosine utilization system XapX-like protein